MKKIILLMTVILAIATQSQSQEPSTQKNESLNVTVLGILDNREFGRGEGVDKTIFYIQPAVQYRFLLDNANNIYLGLTYQQEFGNAELQTEHLQLLAYYHYNSNNLQFWFGQFPRTNSLDVPTWFYGSDAVYYRPFYVSGAAVKAGVNNFFASAWVDWVGLRSETVNEAFLFGYGTKFSHGAFELRHDFMMYHHALTYPRIEDEHVRDNGGVSAQLSWAPLTRGNENRFLDTLSFSAGAILGLDRDRGNGEWHTPAGGVFGAIAGRGMFALRGEAYVGEEQNQIYTSAMFSHLRATRYGRLDVIFNFLRRDNISVQLYPSFYIVDGEFATSQHFFISAKY